MTKLQAALKEKAVLEKALRVAAKWIYDRAQTYSYSCPHCPCSHDNDKCRVCFGPCVGQIVKELKNRVHAAHFKAKAEKGGR